jgi:signal peptidase II
MTAMSWSSPRLQGMIAAIAALALDQGSKLFMLYMAGFADMTPSQHIPVLPFFNLVMVWNPGISYGLFAASSPWGRWFLVAIAAVVVVCLAYWLWQTASKSLAIGLGLIIGGAIGNNLIDRVIYGRVADFFQLYAFAYVFNIADITITLGAVAIIYEVLKPAHPVQQNGK